jgi:hypothetical protein
LDEEGDDSDVGELDAVVEPKPDIGEALIADAYQRDMLTKLTRYEASLVSSLVRTLQLLHAFQAQPEAKLIGNAPAKE